MINKNVLPSPKILLTDIVPLWSFGNFIHHSQTNTVPLLALDLSAL